MLFDEVYKIGDYARLEGTKKPLIVVEAGKHFMRIEGVRGSRWLVCENNGKIEAYNARSKIWREVLTPSTFVTLWNDGSDQDFFKSAPMDERNKDIFIEDLKNNGIKRIIVKEFKE